MAGEIRAQVSFRITKGQFDDAVSLSISADQAGTGGGNPGVVDIGTTDEPIAVGDLASSQGWAIFQNIDDTNYVEVGPEVAGVMHPLFKMMPGEFAFMRLTPTVVLRARANTAACRLSVKIYDA